MDAVVKLPTRLGIDRSIGPLNAEGVFDLFNFRQCPTQSGRIEQTRYFNANTLSRGSYWNGAASTQEPTTSAIRLNASIEASLGVTITDYCVFVSTQIQVFQQTAYPASESINTGCLLVINNVTALGITLGSTLDVVIDGATTFKWRKNGGAYTTLVPITTAGVSIDGGNATVYFLTATGFTIADTWSWKRTDCAFEDSGKVITRPVQYFGYNRVMYYTSHDLRVMAIKRAATSSEYYAISLGYRPVYGICITVYQNHFIVGGFSKSVMSIGSTDLRIVGWSDVLDLENFIPTDTNEADQKTLTPIILDDDTNYGLGQAVLSVNVLNQQLFAFTGTTVFVTSYIGLPNVFSFVEYSAFRITATTGTSPVIPAPSYLYVIGESNIYRFDGTEFVPIGQPILRLTSFASAANSGNQLQFSGYYDHFNQELLLVYGGLLFAYQVEKKTWYTRSVSFDNLSGLPCLFSIKGRLTIGGKSLTSYRDNPASWTGAAPANDYNSGASMAVPKITFHPMGESLINLKEITSSYVGVTLASAVDGYSISSTYYSIGANCQVKLYWYDTTNGVIEDASATSDSNSTWVSSAVDGKLSAPRISSRGPALEIRLVGLDGTKPPALASIVELSLPVRGERINPIER